MSAALAVSAATALPAQGAPPANDAIAAATAITAVPSSFTQDTRQATAVATDGKCVLGRSIWYRFRPTVTRRVRMVTAGSDYDTVLAVFQGTRANRTLVACNDDRIDVDSGVQPRFVAGSTYWIAVSACCSSTARGGHTLLTVSYPRPPGISATVDGVESGGVSGRLFVSGTVQCDSWSDGYVSARVSQRVGPNVARGTSGVGLVCTTEPYSYRLPVDSETGWAFQPGVVAVTLFGSSWDGFTNVQTEETTNQIAVDNPDARRQSRR